MSNIKFSRNFAQVFTSDINRGGFNLIVSVERPEDHCGPWKFFAFKLDPFSASNISKCIQQFKKSSLIKIQAYVLVVKIDLVHLTHNCFLRVENHTFVKVELADFCCVISRKNFQRDSVFVYFSTLCIYEWRFFFNSNRWTWQGWSHIFCYQCTWNLICEKMTFFRDL